MSPDETNIQPAFPDYQICLSVTGTVLFANNHLLADLGYHIEEIQNVKRFSELLTVGSRIFYDTHFFPLIRLHGGYDEIFVTFLARNGAEVPVLLNVKTDSLAGEQVFFCAGIRVSRRLKFEKEIREARRVAEEALLSNEHLQQLQDEIQSQKIVLEKRLQNLSQQNAELRQLNNILSHDLQEPLRKIALFSMILAQEGLGIIRPEWNTHLGKISRSAQTIREMVNAIQHFIALGDHRLRASRFSLRDVFTEAQSRVADLFDFDCRFYCEDAEIHGDRELLVRLFAELFANSARFRNKDQPTTHISVRADIVEENYFREMDDSYRYHEFSRIRYSDDGIGFPAKFSNDVFVLFRKAHIIDEGHGVGLAVCRKIVSLHHGSISATSEPGKGTIFTLLLPLEPVTEPQPARRTPAEPAIHR